MVYSRMGGLYNDENEDSHFHAFSESYPFWKWGGRELIHLAAEKGRLDVVQKLVGMGRSVDMKDDSGLTPLMYAASGGHFDVVQFLVSKKASIHEVDILGYSASEKASINHYEDIFNYLTVCENEGNISEE